MKHILIVEPDESFAARLYQALVTANGFKISAAPNSREATLIVAQQPLDLALVPYEAGPSLLHALRQHQPTLRLVLVVPQADAPLPPRIAGVIQGVLARPTAVRDAPGVVEEVLKQPVQWSALPDRLEPADAGALMATLQGLKLDERVFSVLIIRDGDLVGHSGTLGEEQATAVADRLQETWQPGLTSQLQFIRLPSRTADLLLFTRPLVGNHLLTLVTRPDLPLGLVRRQMDDVLERIGEMVATPPTPPPAETVVSARAIVPTDASSYAIVWGPSQPLPEMLHIPLRRSLERIAAAHGCVLSHLRVTAEMVHIVVTAPAGRSSAWAANAFKRESERAIKEQFGIDSALWGRGYYATGSANPLTQAELDLFLNRAI